MSRELINRNADLKRLREDGYHVEVRASYLLLKSVPYVNAQRQVKRDGILVSSLNLAGDVTKQPDDHQVQFVGEHPCHKDGSLMTEVISGNNQNKLAAGLIASFSFSQKPQRGHYLDYHEKMATYAAILESHAAALEPGLSARVNRVEEADPVDNSSFHYIDTASGRADINSATAKLALPKTGIVGLGGTGAYVLDLVAKTPSQEIHLFDGDVFNTHNAFRAPGAPSIEQLREQPLKVDYFKSIYSRMHKGIVAYPVYIDDTNVHLLNGMSFVFLCLDVGEAKALIVKKLEEYGVPFIDVGMGLYIKDESIAGILRVTASTPTHRKHVHEKHRIPLGKAAENDEYDRNIQVADLNALNAALAVGKWKKLRGFYADSEKEHYSTYTIDCHLLTSDDNA
jgi:predicted ThiF/HesA family dinucleotide-utilizing enzyme